MGKVISFIENLPVEKRLDITGREWGNFCRRHQRALDGRSNTPPEVCPERWTGELHPHSEDETPSEPW